MRMNKLLLAGAFFASSLCGALAEPITYKFTVQGPGQGPVPGFTATLDGQPIGGGDDVVTFTFVADTSDVDSFSVPGAFGYVNFVGTASFSVLDLDTMELVASGTFAPADNIFVSVDDKNGGIGFGSNPANGAFPGDAAYPLGIEFSTATTQYDLKSEIGIFGSGSLSCAGFPGACVAPPILATTAGDLVLGGPNGESSTSGTFVAEFTSGGVSPPPAPIPEPSTWAMMLLGFAGLGWAGYRTRRRTAAAA
jgi:PEP-CTERM motif